MSRFFALFVIAFCLFGVPVPQASAQSKQSLINSRDITTLCRFGKNVNPRGCALLKNSFDVPPYSLFRFTVYMLARAVEEDREKGTRDAARRLISDLQDSLGSRQQIRSKMLGPLVVGGSNASLILETAFITRLKECKADAPRVCLVFESNFLGTLRQALELVGTTYPEHKKTWDRVQAALDP